MVKVSVLYPAKAGSRFDETYYLNEHMPMVMRLLAPQLQGVSVDAGISGAMPDQPAAFVMACHLIFESTAAFYLAFVAHAPAIQGDIVKYTDVEPIIQLSEIKLSR
jgi:uncharacterized protein (TIGR02118 family)